MSAMRQYVVDAFTNEVFHGNPAAVCVMDDWPSDGWMQRLAAENRLSETAFLVREAGGWRLRWFTPGCEVELCGHATLASAFVVLGFYDTGADEVAFSTMGGEIAVRRRGDLLAMDLPTFELAPVPVMDAMERTFGARPKEAVLGLDLVCVFDEADRELVRSMEPAEEALLALPGRIQNVTVAGEGALCQVMNF